MTDAGQGNLGIAYSPCSTQFSFNTFSFSITLDGKRWYSVYEGETIEIPLTRSTGPNIRGSRIYKGEGEGTAILFLPVDKGYSKFNFLILLFLNLLVLFLDFKIIKMIKIITLLLLLLLLSLPSSSSSSSLPLVLVLVS